MKEIVKAWLIEEKQRWRCFFGIHEFGNRRTLPNLETIEVCKHCGEWARISKSYDTTTSI